MHLKCVNAINIEQQFITDLSLSLSFSNIFTWQTYNALFIIRSLSKYFVEHLSEELILQQFEAKPKEMGGGSGHTALYIIQVNSNTESIIK